MINPSQPVRGWLLFFVVWMFINIIIGIGMNLLETAAVWNEQPGLRTAMFVCLLLSLAWYLSYAWFLILLLRHKARAVKYIKFMLLGTPVFIAIMPCVFSWLAHVTINASFSEVLKLLYTPAQWGNMAGTLTVSLLWYWYFCVSRRVAIIKNEDIPRVF